RKASARMTRYVLGMTKAFYPRLRAGQASRVDRSRSAANRRWLYGDILFRLMNVDADAETLRSAIVVNLAF
ncbi:hypothetical protein QIG12_27720, partial [Klebsiella pneumoniae]|nr:hypothetical protein [Klebsiella pneumoniae]